MPIDPFDPGTSVAQEFPTQEPDTFRRLAQIIAAQKREMFDLRASVLANVSDIVADLRVAVDAATAASAAATAAVAAQAAQLVSINALIGQQTRPDAGNAASGTVNPMPASGGYFATITFNVPAGYTVASVVGNSSATIAIPGGSSAEVATNIAGLNGPSITVYAYNPVNVGDGSSNFSRVFSVTPGGTFTVGTYVVSSLGGLGRFTTAASVTFLR